MNFDAVSEYLPRDWLAIVHIKTIFYRAESNVWASKALLLSYKSDLEVSTCSASSQDYVTASSVCLPCFHFKVANNKEKAERGSDVSNSSTCDVTQLFQPPQSERVSRRDTGKAEVKVTTANKKSLGTTRTRFKILLAPPVLKSIIFVIASACCRRALIAHEEAIRTHAQQDHVTRIAHWHDVHAILRSSHAHCCQQFSELEAKNHLDQQIQAITIRGKVKFNTLV